MWCSVRLDTVYLFVVSRSSASSCCSAVCVRVLLCLFSLEMCVFPMHGFGKRVAADPPLSDSTAGKILRPSHNLCAVIFVRVGVLFPRLSSCFQSCQNCAATSTSKQDRRLGGRCCQRLVLFPQSTNPQSPSSLPYTTNVNQSVFIMRVTPIATIVFASMSNPYSVHANHHLRRQHRQADRVLNENDHDRQPLISLTSCTTDNDCRDGYRCGNEDHPDLQITVCEQLDPLPVRSECDEHTDCETGLCHDGVCKIPLDKDCTNNIDCITGRCDNICLIPRKEGETCDEPSDCTSGHCGNEKCVAVCASDKDCSLGLECLHVENVGSFCLDPAGLSSDASANDPMNSKIGGDGSSVFDRDGDGARDNGFDGVSSSAPSVSNAPSFPPSVSSAPSSSPTETGQPSPGPTVPTGSPYPSPSPTELPSMSASPSQMPSLPPSLAPTEEMSMVPSSSPSSSPSELPSSIPSDIPSSFPSSMPSKAPTPVPTPTPCDHIHVELLTEDWVDESTISLLRGNIGLDKRGPFPGKLTRYTFDYCVDPGVCHEVLLEDEHGDGICCQYGNGYFKVYVNGAFVGQSPTGWWSEFHQPINCASNASYIGR